MNTCEAVIGKDAAAFGFVPRRCTQSVGLKAIVAADGSTHHSCPRWGHTESVIRQFGLAPDPETPVFLHEDPAFIDHEPTATAESEYATWTPGELTEAFGR